MSVYENNWAAEAPDWAETGDACRGRLETSGAHHRAFLWCVADSFLCDCSSWDAPALAATYLFGVGAWPRCNKEALCFSKLVPRLFGRRSQAHTRGVGDGKAGDRRRTGSVRSSLDGFPLTSLFLKAGILLCDVFFEVRSNSSPVTNPRQLASATRLGLLRDTNEAGWSCTSCQCLLWN